MQQCENRFRLYKRFRVGRFRVSLFLLKKASIDFVKACIEYKEFDEDSNSWKRRLIWCMPHELNDLAQVLLYLRE